MSDSVIAISVVRDFQLYERLFSNNQNLKSCELKPIDNRTENHGIPTRYNEFLDSFDYSKPAWFVFCHEDFEFREPIIQLLSSCSKDILYGPIGVSLVNYFGYHKVCYYGMIKECKRDGTGSEWKVGKFVPHGKQVKTFDCCCLIVHSSLIKKYHLRFDENLPFDFYVEDFCATASLRYGIVSQILQMNACHHSGSAPTDRLFRHTAYLEKKYPNCCVPSTCGIYGTRSWMLRLQKKVHDLLLGDGRGKGKK